MDVLAMESLVLLEDSQTVFPCSGPRPSELPPDDAACLVIDFGTGWKVSPKEAFPMLGNLNASCMRERTCARIVALFTKVAVAQIGLES